MMNSASHAALGKRVRALNFANLGAQLQQTRNRIDAVGMRGIAFLVVLGVLSGGVAFAAAELDSPRPDWILFAVLATAATASRLFTVHATQGSFFATTAWTFLVAAAVVLPTNLLVVILVAASFAALTGARRAWLMELANFGNSLLALATAQLVLHLPPFGELLVESPRTAVAYALAAVIATVLLNSCALASLLAVRNVRLTLRDLIAECRSDSTLALIGVLLAFVLRVSPVFGLFVLALIVVVHKSLYVARLEAEVVTDPKTNLYNMRHFDRALKNALEIADRRREPASILACDLDLLRDINNTHGHLAGDAAIEKIARVITANVRTDDVAARFGGEEFLILLPGTSKVAALRVAERIRSGVAGNAFALPVVDAITISVSIGVATFPIDGRDVTSLVKTADDALYEAKASGRNRVIGAGSNGRARHGSDDLRPARIA